MALESFEKEALDAYNYDKRKNINENGVLMVTITLSEYRELVIAVAKAEQHKNDMSNWELQREVERLKQQILDMTIGTSEVK